MMTWTQRKAYERAIALSDRLSRKDPLAELNIRKAALPKRQSAHYRSELDANGHRRFFDDQGRAVARKDLPAWIRRMTDDEFVNASLGGIPPRYFDLPGSFRLDGGSLAYS